MYLKTTLIVCLACASAAAGDKAGDKAAEKGPADDKPQVANKQAEVGPAKAEDEAAREELAGRRSAAPTTVPNDAEVITALTEGERRIAEKNPRAAEASFQKVLTRYPDQARAWYGIGLVALLDHDAARAKRYLQ